jgi:hypothetical protein
MDIGYSSEMVIVIGKRVARSKNGQRLLNLRQNQSDRIGDVHIWSILPHTMDGERGEALNSPYCAVPQHRTSHSRIGQERHYLWLCDPQIDQQHYYLLL